MSAGHMERLAWSSAVPSSASAPVDCHSSAASVAPVLLATGSTAACRITALGAFTCAAAAATYGTPTYGKMSSTCIGQDLSWRKPAAKWEAVLEEMMFNSGYGKKQMVVTPKEDLEGAKTTAAR